MNCEHPNRQIRGKGQIFCLDCQTELKAVTLWDFKLLKWFKRLFFSEN